MTAERRDWVGFAVALAIAAGCVRLGVWQLARLHQRRALNAAVRAARERPPLELRGPIPVDSARDRRLSAHGVYDYAHEQLWHGRSYEGVPGVDLLTPLRLGDGAAVLVDRGWAPSPDAYHVDEQAWREPDTADVFGLGMLAPRSRGDVDPAKLQPSLPYPLLPFVIELLPAPLPARGAPSATPTPTPPAGPRLVRWPAPELSDGPHLSYAIQWFSFAVIIVVGSVVLLRKRMREAPGPGNRPTATINTLS